MLVLKLVFAVLSYYFLSLAREKNIEVIGNNAIALLIFAVVLMAVSANRFRKQVS